MIEQETIITFNQEESWAEIYTASPIMKRKLDKLCEKYPDAYELMRIAPSGVTYKCPKDRVRLAPPPSDARRAAGRKGGFQTRQ